MTLNLWFILFIIAIITLTTLCICILNSFNPKSKRHEPRKIDAPVDTERFSISRARSKLPLQLVVPGEMDLFNMAKMKFPQDDDWRDSAQSLARICAFVRKLICFVYTTSIDYKGRDTFMSIDVIMSICIVELFVLHVYSKLQLLNVKKKFPWGNNWYQFSVDLTSTMAYYLLWPETLIRFQKQALAIIDSIIETPIMSLGWKRTGANSVYMSGPWLLSRLLHGDRDIETDPAYAYVTDVCQLNYCKTPFGKGLHIDGAYISHDTICGWGYLKNMISDITTYLYALDRDLVSPADRWQEIADIVYHPTVNRGPPGIHGRNESFVSPCQETAVSGIRVVPSIRFIRYHTQKYKFNARGVHGKLGYYEADKANYRHPQLWVQSRVPYKQDGPSSMPTYKNAYGLFSVESNDDYVHLPSREETTDIRYPTDKSRSFVAHYDSLGVLYQEYTIPEFGDFHVRELVIVNAQIKSIDCYLLLVNNDKKKDLIFRGKSSSIDPWDYTVKLDVFKIAARSSDFLQTTIDMDHGLMSTRSRNVNEFPSFPLTFDSNNRSLGAFNSADQVTVHETGIVVVNNVPHIDATHCDIVSKTLKFNKDLNQYTF